LKDLDISAAVAALHRGGVIAYPTEAVWGLGCDPMNEAAVMRLLAIKQRDVGKGLILIAAYEDQFDALLDWDALPPDRAEDVYDSWPGPNTWIVPAHGTVPRWITGDHAGVAARVSAHPTVVALCQAFGGPITSTSANLAGAPPVFTRERLDSGLIADLDGVVAGETGGDASPSTIRDARSGQVLRA